MTWMELLDESTAFFETVCDLDEPEYDQLVEVLCGKIESEETVPQQLINSLSEIQKEVDALKVARSALGKKICGIVIKGVATPDTANTSSMSVEVIESG